MKNLSSVIKRKFSGSRLNHVQRFYKEVNVEKYEEKEGHYRVLLDSRRIKTPDGHPYYLPSKALAYMIAKEFDLQKEYIKTSSMPLVKNKLKSQSLE